MDVGSTLVGACLLLVGLLHLSQRYSGRRPFLAVVNLLAGVLALVAALPGQRLDRVWDGLALVAAFLLILAAAQVIGAWRRWRAQTESESRRLVEAAVGTDRGNGGPR